jgi:type VI secretion system Hcp family effector
MYLDAFVSFEGSSKIEGESTDSFDEAKQPAKIAIVSFEHAIQRSRRSAMPDASDKDQAAARSQHGNFTFIKPLDKATPKLCQAVCGGGIYPTATISLVGPLGDSENSFERKAYLQIVLKEVYVARVRMIGDPRVHTVGHANAYLPLAADVLDGPLEEIDLSYTAIKWVYTPLKEDNKTGGAIEAMWDLPTNKATF